MSENPYRLPRTVVPHHYRLRLEPDLESFTFSGSEAIEVEVAEATDQVTLNAIELDITSAAAIQGDRRLEGSVTYDADAQRATLNLDGHLEAGAATLELEFTGILNDQLHGFYRSRFTDVDGHEQVIATTQFEATDARRAFPSFDEPDLKASFGITLVVPEDLLAVSNSGEVSREPAGDGKVAITYADTMKMSTYLVAFVVGPFIATDPVDVDGVPLRVIAPKGKEHLTDFALECGAFCLRYFRDYYGIPYPGDKVDFVAIPDFAFGAMENLGCITFRETALLVDPDEATQAELVRILDVVGHELAHMWFGDLVTMDWWDGIWLNEAFASFMEMKSTDAMRPQWKRWLAFAAIERPWAYGVDALHSTRPVEFEVTSPDEANEMFDALTYGKGSSVLRMMEQYLGEDTFRDGVGIYLRRHAYANTVTADLWAGLDEASGEPVGEIMDTWILQGGFPQVEVELADGGIRLTQRRFLSIPDDADQTTWKIPVQVRGESGGAPFEVKHLLEHPSEVVPLEGPVDWVVANAGGHGFYRVTYSETLQKALLAQLPHLDDIERYCIIDDAWAFVECGQLSAPGFLELAGAYREEREHSIWQAVVGGLGSIRHHLVTDAQLNAYRSLVSELIAPTVERLGWEPAEGEADLTRRLRGLILGAMGRLAEDPEVVDRSREIARRWLDSAAGLDPDVAQASLFTLAAHGGADEYEQVFAAYREASSPQTQFKLLQAVTFFDDPGLVDRTFGAVLDGSIRTQDSAWVVARLLRQRESGPHAWRRLRKQWEEVTATMPPMTIRRMVEGLPALSQPEVAADVKAFFAEVNLPVATKTIRQNLERLDANVAMRQRETESLAEYLNQR